MQEKGDFSTSENFNYATMAFCPSNILFMNKYNIKIQTGSYSDGFFDTVSSEKLKMLKLKI